MTKNDLMEIETFLTFPLNWPGMKIKQRQMFKLIIKNKNKTVPIRRKWRKTLRKTFLDETNLIQKFDMKPKPWMNFFRCAIKSAIFLIFCVAINHAVTESFKITRL